MEYLGDRQLTRSFVPAASMVAFSVTWWYNEYNGGGDLEQRVGVWGYNDIWNAALQFGWVIPNDWVYGTDINMYICGATRADRPTTENIAFQTAVAMMGNGTEAQGYLAQQGVCGCKCPESDCSDRW